MKAWLDDLTDSQQPFVAFRPPDARYVTCLSESEENNEKGSAEYWFAPYNIQDRSILKLQHPQGFKVDRNTLAKPEPFEPVRIEKERAEKTEFIRRVEDVQSAIQDGEVSKVVLSRTISLSVHRDAWIVFLHMLSRYNKAYCYWWYHPESGHWMGATPEVLLSEVKGEVQIMSLAGTLPADTSTESDWSEKEREEQALVTRYIEEVLKAHGARVIKEGPVTVSTGKLLHLKTLLKTRNIDKLEALINHLHPTPAVCGYPLSEASGMIAAHEAHDREYYTGYLGIHSMDPAVPTQLYVNLRCMKWSPGKITLYVGGGITAASDAESEWLETIYKSRTLLDILDITRV